MEGHSPGEECTNPVKHKSRCIPRVGTISSYFVPNSKDPEFTVLLRTKPWFQLFLGIFFSFSSSSDPQENLLWKFDHLLNTIPNANQSSINYPALISSWVNVAALVALPASVPLGNAVA
ncbi:hypothetical protein HCEG_07726 [Histoplasma capsulatum var. duboisii H88]|uniref:Uncharacterized protein n=2 Tax=Ajellomyces capsulatus TaxID=5037 RepID=F0URI4_AJEC8|nr:hypothetical protein HCDG_05672 [Histoplasma capsulatum H143]EGC48511.1 hypothetical protein HCEG_07726 [Histoplasma capsulatum var. duboisii H88]